jgi:hypothetical protein
MEPVGRSLIAHPQQNKEAAMKASTYLDPSRRRIRWTTTVRAFSAVILSSWITACGGDQSASGDAAASSPTRTSREARIALDACALLTPTDAESLLGEGVGEPNRLVHEEDETTGEAVSDCAYYSLVSDKRVDLMVGRSPLNDNPKTIAEWLRSLGTWSDPSETRHSLALWAGFDNAFIEENPPVSGIGDIAVWYEYHGVEYPGVNLQAFWGGNLFLKAGVHLGDASDPEEALELAKDLARRVIARL